MYKNKTTVLYLDDEPANLKAFTANFRRDYHVLTAQCIEDAFDVIENHEVSVVVSDHKMPHITGIEFFETLSKAYPNIVRVLLTGCSEVNTVLSAVNKAQIFRYLCKPMDAKEMGKTIVQAQNKYVKNIDSEKEVHHLQQANKKLEFMLRQRLIS
ncbi:MAG: two-component system sensor histidine kinase/response regulator [Bacteroidia bacterium]|jgi:two-component system sensor histidine kinase/response regulator